MKKWKKRMAGVFFWAAVLLCAGITQAGEETQPVKIITTIFPVYDWTANILGDNPGNASLSLLLDNGADLHSYQPTADDMLNISTCDLFIYVGGESDRWVTDALKDAVNQDMVVINLLEVLGDAAREEETVEGMQAEEKDAGAEDTGDGDAEGGSEDSDAGEAHGAAPEYDEHVWLSLKNASLFADSIAGALAGIDAADAESYQANAAAYKEKLAALDAQYQETVDSAGGHVLLFGDRFPFRYLTDDYGLEYYAAFAGCSAETEASFDTVIFLAGKMDELKLPAILTIEGGDRRIAQTILQACKEKGQEILTLDSMQATTSEDIKNGITYLSVMENNLEILRAALE